MSAMAGVELSKAGNPFHDASGHFASKDKSGGGGVKADAGADHGLHDLHDEHKAMLAVMPADASVDKGTGGRTIANWSTDAADHGEGLKAIVSAAKKKGFKSEYKSDDGADGEGASGRSEFLKHPDGHRLYVSSESDAKGNQFHTASLQLDKPKAPAGHASALNPEHANLTAMMPAGSVHASLKSGVTSSSWLSEDPESAQHVDATIERAKSSGFKLAHRKEQNDVDGSAAVSTEVYHHPDGHKLTIDRERLTGESAPLHSMLMVAKPKNPPEKKAKGKKLETVEKASDGPKRDSHGRFSSIEAATNAAYAATRDARRANTPEAHLAAADLHAHASSLDPTGESDASHDHKMMASGHRDVARQLKRNPFDGYGQKTGYQSLAEAAAKASKAADNVPSVESHLKAAELHRAALERAPTASIALNRHGMIASRHEKAARGLAANRGSVSKSDSVGCIMLNLPDELRSTLHEFQRQISPDNLVSLEDTPHITVRYGVRSSPDEVAEVLSGYGTVLITCGDVGVFAGADHDVVYIDVVPSGEIMELRDTVDESLDCDPPTHGEYHPHITLAYVKSGTGDRYAALANPLEGQTFELSQLKYAIADEFDMEENESEEGEDDDDGDESMEKSDGQGRDDHGRFASGGGGASGGGKKKSLVVDEHGNANGDVKYSDEGKKQAAAAAEASKAAHEATMATGHEGALKHSVNALHYADKTSSSAANGHVDTRSSSAAVSHLDAADALRAAGHHEAADLHEKAAGEHRLSGQKLLNNSSWTRQGLKRLRDPGSRTAKSDGPKHDARGRFTGKDKAVEPHKDPKTAHGKASKEAIKATKDALKIPGQGASLGSDMTRRLDRWRGVDDSTGAVKYHRDLGDNHLSHSRFAARDSDEQKAHSAAAESHYRAADAHKQRIASGQGNRTDYGITNKSDSDSGDEFQSAYEFFKSEERADHTFVLGPVLVPDIEDNQGDIIDADEIEKCAHEYLAESAKPGVMHAAMLGSRQAQVVESYITREVTKRGDEVLPAGTWMLAMKVYDDKLRSMVRDGRLRGFSIGGRAGAVKMEDRPA